MFIMFKSNNWGQDKGFSAVFTSEKAICGEESFIPSHNLYIRSPRLDKAGHYRRGYFSCR